MDRHDDAQDVFGSIPWAEQEASDRRLADRLDAAETERVLARAIELEDASTDAAETFSAEDLERIAAEIGINPQFVRQAVAEVRADGGARRRLDTWLLPEPIHEQATIAGVSRTGADRLIRRWMTEYEGMMPVARVAGGAEWETDRHALVRLRTALNSGANRLSRSVPGPVSHRVASVGDDEHIVTLAADTDHPLMLAKAGAAVGAGLGLLILTLGLAAGSVLSVLPALVTFGLVGGGSIFAARQWGRSMKRALRKALTGLTNQRVRGTDRPSRESGSSRRRNRRGRPQDLD